MKRCVRWGVVFTLFAAGCQSREPEQVAPTGGVTLPPASTAPSTTAPPSTTSTTTTTTTMATTTSRPPTPASTPVDRCTEIGGDPAAAPAEYGETALDRFGPLELQPSLTVGVGHDDPADPIGLGGTRIEGGVIVTVSHSSTRASTPDDRVLVTAIEHDGTIRWSRCLAGNGVVETAVAAPEHRPANALMHRLVANVPAYRYDFVQISLSTGAEQPAFADAMRSVGVDAAGLGRFGVSDVTDRYALLVDRGAVTGDTYERIVRYDLVADVAVDVGVPPELIDRATPAGCDGEPQLSLSSAGGVVVTDLVTDGFAGPAEIPGTGPVLAAWRDGVWSSDPVSLAGVVDVRPGFACGDDPAVRVLRGVDVLGEVRWTDPDLTHPGTDDVGWYLDGDVAVGQVCSVRAGGDCDRFELVGLDPATGAVRWTQSGPRLVATDPADGYVLVSAETPGDGVEPPGWVLLDDRTGSEVPGQRWDTEAFTLYPSREVGGFDGTRRAGGAVIVVQDDHLQVWYPLGRGGGPPRTVLLL